MDDAASGTASAEAAPAEEKREAPAAPAAPVVKTPKPLNVGGTHWSCPKCAEMNRAARTECNNCGASKPPKGVFVIGQKVQRHDDGEEWGVGFVTSLDPLLVTVSGSNRSQWPRVVRSQ